MSGWAILCFAIGGACGLVGLVLLVLDLMKYRKATGTIIGNKSHTNETVERFAPTIRFQPEDGEERTFQSVCYFSSTPYPKGESIPVRYHPTNEKINGIDRLLPRFFLVVPLAFFAAMFIALAMQI